MPAAMVVLRPGASVGVEALKACTLANGPAYAHPRKIMIVDAIPIGLAGKPDKALIRATLAGG